MSLAPRLHVLQHDAMVPVALFGPALPSDTVTVRLDLGEPLPDLDHCSGVISLGGTMGAYDGADFPFLEAEKAFLSRAHDAAVPVLGVCLGCQLLAEALGGSAYRAPVLEAHFGPCRLTPEGAADPVARHLADPVLTLHQDTWDAPPDAALLAYSALYPQAFRLGTSLGIQPHPEVTTPAAAEWISHHGPHRIEATGASPDELLTALDEDHAGRARLAGELVTDWLAG